MDARFRFGMVYDDQHPDYHQPCSCTLIGANQLIFPHTPVARIPRLPSHAGMRHRLPSEASPPDTPNSAAVGTKQARPKPGPKKRQPKIAKDAKRPVVAAPSGEYGIYPSPPPPFPPPFVLVTRTCHVLSALLFSSARTNTIVVGPS